jgi:hypothetical protein
MPTLLACPSCRGQLRVPDELVGRSIRCAACQTVFEATPPTANGTPPPAAVPVPAAQPAAGFQMNLSLDDQPKAQRASAAAVPAAAPAPKPEPETVDAEEVPDAKPAPNPPPERPSWRRERRWRDDEEDERDRDNQVPCPECGEDVVQGCRRCYHCGEHLDQDDWDRTDRKPRRRDWEPHRGGLILTLGILSAILSAVVLGVLFGLIGLILGSSDLRRIRAGEMDPEGRANTNAGWICSLIGMILSVVFLLFYSALIWLVVEASRPVSPNPAVIRPAPGWKQNPAPNPGWPGF